MRDQKLTCIGCPLGCSISVSLSENGEVSVKTAEDIPKGKIFDCMEALKKVTVTAPVQIGEVIIKNVCGTGVDVIATKKVNALT